MAHIQPPPVLAYGIQHATRIVSEELRDLPRMSTRTFVGILVAISGNVLIAFALNLQKLVHKRIGARYLAKNNGRRVSKHNDSGHPSFPPESDREESRERGGDAADEGSLTPRVGVATLAATQPLLEISSTNSYGSALDEPRPTRLAPLPPGDSPKKRTFASRMVPFKIQTNRGSSTTPTLPVDILSEEAALHGLSNRKNLKRAPSSTNSSVESYEGDYLKSKVWWLGFLLMNVGEVGNFISYAFAPASVVAPLGTFALIANCFFAPLMLGERFRTRDLLGVSIAIVGAVTVVFASNASDTRLDVDNLLLAIRQIPFLIFSIIYIVGVIVLAALSQSNWGRRWAVIDVGLCALFGGFTVLSTKALSTLLTIEWLHIFTRWITYPLILVLLGTGVGQIRYLNRALMRFDSKTVIPMQFVLFTLSAIIGSAILYGDFKKARFHQIVTFLYGCAATFTGVFIIAWAPSPQDTTDDDPDAGLGEESTPASENPNQPRLGLGTIGRRRRATLVLPSGVRDTPSVRHKRSTIGMGISPAQHLLLVHTPPSEMPISAQLREDRLHDTDPELGNSPDSYGQPEGALSWYGNDIGVGSRTRESSLTGRRQNGLGYGRFAGSADTQSSHR
ncbi:DUF803-domain-containing protein [Coprinopsis marcescibilis]|uniref:DUF803-domain-containing protein n=1 Tax=Coprinopsis marcescibilis TaxID=230819 RepID=A0A5C3LKU4_COPMA|nr:DUF803-domain-containing protein [Coprinopsis marcescibilis]